MNINLIASSTPLLAVYANWNMSKPGGNNDLTKFKNICSRHFIITDVRATGL